MGSHSGEEVPRPRMSPATIAAKVSGQLPNWAPPSLASPRPGQCKGAQQVVFRAPRYTP